MGPLMDLSHPLCLRNQKSSDAWSKYIKGASAIFVWYISRGERVTVLLPPPPERFHPSGQTNYQAIEEPIVKGLLGTNAASRIEMVHPTVKGAEDIYYQIWPVDNTTTWTARFGELNVQKRRWRMVKSLKDLSNKLGDMEIAKAHQEAKEKEKGKEKAKAKEKAKKEKKVRKSKKEEEKKKEKKREEEKAKMEKKKTRKAEKERKKARKVKKERKKAKKEAKGWRRRRRPITREDLKQYAEKMATDDNRWLV